MNLNFKVRLFLGSKDGAPAYPNKTLTLKARSSKVHDAIHGIVRCGIFTSLAGSGSEDAHLSCDEER